MSLRKFKLKPIAGDASFRKYYRKFNQPSFLSTIIVTSKKEKFKNLLVYSAINQFLLNKKIKTPKLILQNYKKGYIEIEDFGKKTIYMVLKKSKNRFSIYKKIIKLLVKLQKVKPQNILNFFNKVYELENYSIQKLNKESDLFFDWYLPLIMEKDQAKKLSKVLKKKLHKLYKKIKFKNDIFVHRDFHVSNLMKINKQIGLIDSQDAIIGNPAYDLASLIDDVRIKTSGQLKKNIFNYYLSKCSSKYKKQKNNFIYDFNILSVQRNLKIIGIFARLFKRDKKKKYLQLIPYAWKLIELRSKDKIFNEVNIILNKFISLKQRKKIKFHAN